MQIHIHKDGKTFGPYPIEQVRQYLKVGNFSGNDLACHDGANWIKLSQVPGVAPTKPKTVAKQVEQPAKVETKPSKKLLGIKLLLAGFFLALVISLAGLTYNFSFKQLNDTTLFIRLDALRFFHDYIFYTIIYLILFIY